MFYKTPGSVKTLLILPVFLVLMGFQTFAQNTETAETIGLSHDRGSIEFSRLFEKIVDDKLTDVIVISKEHHVHNMNMNNKPCATVKDGSRLIFECWDALEGKSKYYFDNNILYNDVRRKGTGNPLTGPVFIEGALPGDVVEVEIHDIRISKYGYMQNMDKNKFIDNADREYVYLEVEVIGDKMLYDGKKMPVHPMVGGIGVGGLKKMTTGEVWENGGNLDTRIIKKGTKVLFPVFTEGALLAMGDVHAVQGDGEVFGKGLEIGADIDVTVRIRRDLDIQRPLVINPDLIATIAPHPDMLKAADLAIMDMGRYLVNEHGFSSIDASALIGFYGNLRIGEIVNPQKTLRMEIEKKYIDLFKE